MSVPRNWWNIENIADGKRWSSLTLFLKDVYNILNKGLVFQDNFRGSVISVSFTASDTNTEVKHGLSFTPTRYLVLSSTVSMNVYDGTTDNTDKYIYLKSSAIGSAEILIF